MMSEKTKRAKFYLLDKNNQWIDQGSGEVSYSNVDSLEVAVIVASDLDGSIILESQIQFDITYEKQQETLVVWTDGTMNRALSFQCKEDCDEMWEQICRVQGRDPLEVVDCESEEESFEGESDRGPTIELPPCELSRLEEIHDFFVNNSQSDFQKENLATFIENEGYIQKLLELFKMCEDLENLIGLHQLYKIFLSIFFLNKNSLLEIMFAPTTIFDIVGILEYDTNSSSPKRHREYLKNISNYKQVIPISNVELIDKIHQTYRVQYIQDVALPTPSIFEENNLSALRTFIVFNKIDIVEVILDDQNILTDVLFQVVAPQTANSERQDLLFFLKELFLFSQHLTNRGKFYKTLVGLGILQTIETTLRMKDPIIKSASISILTFIVSFSQSMVREYAFDQFSFKNKKEVILNIMIEQMICDPDPELGNAVQLSGLLCTLLDPINMTGAIFQKSEKFEFFNFFYTHCMPSLIAPIYDSTTEDTPFNEDLRTAQLLGLILDLLNFFVKNHSHHIRKYILGQDLLRRVLKLMKSKHTFVVLAAVRFMRWIIGLKDEYYNRYIITGNLFETVIEVYMRNNGIYNLLDSAILEMFEFIKEENIKSLYMHVIEKYGNILDQVNYVKTFHTLRNRYEHHQEKKNEKPNGKDFSISLTNRFRKDVRQMDDKEESWFEKDEEDSNFPPEPLSKDLEDKFDKIGELLNKRAKESENDEDIIPPIVASKKSFSLIIYSKPSPSPPLNDSIQASAEVEEPSSSSNVGLVDYEDSDSDDDDLTSPSAKKPKLGD